MHRFIYVLGVRGSSPTKTIDVYKFAAENMRAEVLSKSIHINRTRFGICNRNDQVFIVGDGAGSVATNKVCSVYAVWIFFLIALE